MTANQLAIGVLANDVIQEQVLRDDNVALETENLKALREELMSSIKKGVEFVNK